MGNTFTISVVNDDEDWAIEAINIGITEIQRIEQLLTTFSDDSQTNLVNQNAGMKPIVVAPEMFALVHRAQKISALTQGAFDLSYGSLDKSLWNFDTTMTVLPDAAIALESVRLINYKNIVLDENTNTVFLAEAGMRIGFGGIGKGYAADRARAVMQQFGVKNGIVNASGDLVTWGNQPSGKPWTVGIIDPNNRNKAFSSMKISNMAMATSGNYEKYVMIDGKRYSHTIDPKTGFPVSGIKSATIIAPSAELADALTTPVMVMGVRAGLHLINQLQHIACIIIDDKNTVFTSENIRIRK